MCVMLVYVCVCTCTCTIVCIYRSLIPVSLAVDEPASHDVNSPALFDCSCNGSID